MPLRLALAAAILACRPAPAPAADPALVERLLERIRAIPFVDTHSHLAPPTEFHATFKDRPYDVVWLLSAGTYVAEFTYGKDWAEVKKALEVNGHHGYVRPILEAFRDLYGLPAGEELTDANVGRVSARMDAAHRTPGWYEEVLRRANVAHVLWMDADGKGRDDMPSPAWHPLWNVDAPFVFVTGKDRKTGTWAIDAVRRRFAVKLANLDDMDRLIADRIGDFFRRGGVGLKSTAAYFRSLDFDDHVPRRRAAEVFRKLLAHRELGGAEARLLQDHLMTRVLEAARAHKKPFQFHTGNQQNWNVVSQSSPLGLNGLLFSGNWYDVKFVILHGGYPYVREAITLARYYGNAYLDLAWMALFSPAAAKSALAEALDLLDGSRLMFGTDGANLEEIYGVVKFTRRILAEVLAEKIEGGFLTETAALRAAGRVLSRNAMDLYGLPAAGPPR